MRKPYVTHRYLYDATCKDKPQTSLVSISGQTQNVQSQTKLVADVLALIIFWHYISSMVTRQFYFASPEADGFALT